MFYDTSQLTFAYISLGFKKAIGCTHAIYGPTAKCEMDNYIESGSTVNSCAIDIFKAFDRINRQLGFI